MIEHTVTEGEAGQRLSAVLRTLHPLSQTQARAACSMGAVAIHRVRQHNPSLRLRAGQVVQFEDQHLAESLALGIPIAFADDDVLVLHKPAGLAVHKGPLVDHSVADALAEHYAQSGLCHRLDRDASGLLLIGKHSGALRTLGAAMEQGGIQRHYDAVANGLMAADSQTIRLPLLVTDEPRGDRPKTIVDPAGQPSVSHVRVLARRKEHSLVRVALETGRTHQVRAHLAAVGLPLLGDARYGTADANDSAHATYGIQRTMLHGAHLEFLHPSDGRVIVVDAMREADFARLFPHVDGGPAENGPGHGQSR
ncbi:MAG: RluA family pseudouridine synthase [Planctomycetota bacterium]